MSKRISAISALMLIVGLVAGWLLHSPNTSHSSKTDSTVSASVGAEPVVNDDTSYDANGDQVTSSTEVNVTHLMAENVNDSGVTLGTLWVTYHYTDNTRALSAGRPTYSVTGTPDHNMMCTVAHNNAMLGADHPALTAQNVQNLCDDFQATATSGEWISCLDDLDGLIRYVGSTPTDPQPIVDSLTNGAAEALCNHSVNTQNAPANYSDQLWMATNASVFSK